MFDLWPWTFVVDRLHHGRMLYEIWVKSDNPRPSYCDLNIWPYDLEHVSGAPLCCGIVCTKFKLSQAIRSLFFMLIRHATLWPWPLTFWPWTFVVVRVSCVKTLCKIWVKSNNPLQSYWRFSTLLLWNFWAGRVYTEGSQGCVDQTSPNLEKTYGRHLWSRSLLQSWDTLLHFQRGPLKFERWALFDPL